MRKIAPLIFLFLLFLTTWSHPWKTVEAADIGGLVPEKPQRVWARSGPKAGEVTLYWDTVVYADRYAVAYGPKSNNYLYGADNIGSELSRSYTIKGLSPGMKYYFRLAAARGSVSSPFSNEVSAYAAAGASVQQANTGAIFKAEKTEATAVKKEMVVSSSKDQLYLRAAPGPSVGQVTLTWNKNEEANNYHLVYGKKAGEYTYGALNLGNTSKYTVGYLNPGSLYYFAIVPVKDGKAFSTSSAVKAYALAPMTEEVVVTSREALITPKPAVYNTEPETDLPVGYPTLKPTALPSPY